LFLLNFGERWYSQAQIVFYPFKVDSVDFTSVLSRRGNSTAGVGTPTLAVGAIQDQVVTGTNQYGVRLSLAPSCKPNDSGQSVTTICWTAPVTLPDISSITMMQTDGVSDTTVAETTVDDAYSQFGFVSQSLEQLGSRSSAVHGTFDRPVLRLFTAIPNDYVVGGIAASGWDYRGEISFDWEHSSSSALPNNHISQNKRSWVSVRPNVFRADWSRDSLLMRSENVLPSNCLLPGQSFSKPVWLRFSGGGLPADNGAIGAREVRARSVLSSGQLGPDGEFRVSDISPASGSTAPVLLP
jgi:hypothetical protein